jgi:hypothetical protein
MRRNKSCPLYSRERICAVQEVMSAMGQKRTCRFQLLRSCVAALGHLQAWGHGRAAIFLESELG